MDSSSTDSIYRKVAGKYQDDAEVSAYDQKRFSRPGGRLLNAVQVATVLEMLGPEVLSVLEVGCGTGRFTFAMARAGHTVTGIDYSAPMLDVCRKRQAEEQRGEDVTFVEASIFELPFDEASFDAVVCVHVLMHLPEHEAALGELIRVLKPGGRAIFDIRSARSLNRMSYPFRRLAQRLQGREPWHVWYVTLDSVRTLADKFGADIAETRGMFPLKPYRMPSVVLPILRWFERRPTDAFLRRIGHIQMVALVKREAAER